MADENKKDTKKKKAAKRAPRKKKATVADAAIAPAAPIAGEPSSEDVARLLAGEHANPHSILGAHPISMGAVRGVTLRAMAANATRVEARLEDGRVVQLERHAQGLSDLYAAFIPDVELPLDYHLRIYYIDNAVWERRDPYRF